MFVFMWQTRGLTVVAPDIHTARAMVRARAREPGIRALLGGAGADEMALHSMPPPSRAYPIKSSTRAIPEVVYLPELLRERA